MEKELLNLIEDALRLGLTKQDAKNATDFVIHREWGIAFDVVVSQVYEYDIQVNQAFVDSVFRIARLLELPDEEYLYIKDQLF
jgi:hypothetical protein